MVTNLLLAESGFVVSKVGRRPALKVKGILQDLCATNGWSSGSDLGEEERDGCGAVLTFFELQDDFTKLAKTRQGRVTFYRSAC